MLSDLMENYFQAPKVARKSEPGCPITPKEEGWKIVTDPRRLHRTLSFPSNVAYFDFIRDLINYEQKTNHYGKLVLDYPNITIEVKIVKTTPIMSFQLLFPISSIALGLITSMYD